LPSAPRNVTPHWVTRRLSVRRQHASAVPEYDVHAMPKVAPLYHLQAKRAQRLPTVLTRAEVIQGLGAISGVPGLMVRLLYGSGLRLLEGCSVRVKDLDLVRGEVSVRSGPGSGCFRPRVCTETRQRANSAGIICTRVCCSARYRMRRGWLGFQSESRVTRSGTVLRRIFWSLGTIFAPCRSFWVTPMFVRR